MFIKRGDNLCLMRLKKLIALAGIGTIIGCTSLGNNIKDYERYQTLIVRNYGNFITEGYDTDKDKREDLRYYYKIIGTEEDTVSFELIAVQEDKNRNGRFEEDEFVWKKKGIIIKDIQQNTSS